MSQKITNQTSFFRFVVDVIVIIISFYLTNYIRFSTFWNKLEGEKISILWVIILLYVFIYIFSKNLTNKKPWMYDSKFYDAYNIVKYNVFIGFMLFAYLYTFKIGELYSRLQLFSFFALDILLMLIAHVVLRHMLIKLYRNSSYCERVLLITTTDELFDIVNDIRKTNNWYFRIKGIALMDADMRGMHINNIPIIADGNDFYEVSKNNAFDSVLICLGNERDYSLIEMISNYIDMGIAVHLNLSEYYFPIAAGKRLDNVGVLGVITYREIEYNLGQQIMKRLLDITGGLVGMFLFGIAMLIFGPIIKLDSKGPVLFSQERIGKNGRHFKIYKFRSMCVDAEERKAELMAQNEMSGNMFKMHDDPRVTRIGKFLRKTSIDELPQFWNVFKGDMSLVGTRPPTVEEFEGYTLSQRKRISIKPGITGLWQVSGRSSITDFDKVVELDCKYIDNWSVLTDIKIILRTIWVVLFRKGAQ